ncbi:alpha/beta fold hydrolase [Burkholderia sp. Bp9142]|uniref:alpha/beta fold hydrolase n=1 Tax=Burkholderia sp. Bp9142 TaxID=2184573 RepID=UPI000F5914E8|nr:alpha/beta hydrolase [Burkholderia sp. Bp9142]RQR23276.1 alpha/beta hydrolase [Burkholderia sp. Bp9142]
MKIEFVPGTMCDERLWSRLLPYLGQQIQPHFISLADVSDRDAIHLKLADEIPEGAHVVAFSMGGYLALEHALANPQKLCSLVVIAASARGLGAQERGRRQRMLEHLASRPYAGISRAQVATFLGSAGAADSGLTDLIIEMDHSLGARTFQAQLSASMDRPDLLPSLSTLDCPVLIVGSTDDRLVQVEHLEEMNNALPHCRLRLLHGSGHMIPLEAPEALSREISAFHQSLEAN